MTLITETRGRKAYVRIHVETSFHPATPHEEGFVITGTEATHGASVERIPLTRWCVLKRKENLTSQQKFRLRDLLRYNLQTVRAYLLKDDFQQF